MAESRDNIITAGLRGTIGGQLVFKRYGNRTIVSKVPDMSRVKKSESQKSENNKFREATYYAKEQMADPVAKAEYKAKAKELQKPHNVAISDFYNPPQIRNIDISSLQETKSIVVHAWDDFKVVRVEVEIVNQEGELLEHGTAVELREWFWKYNIQTDLPESIKIVAHAWDKPGNKVSTEILA